MSIPLGIALLLSYWQLERLVEQGESAVYHSVRASEHARVRLAQLVALERLARQYVNTGRADRLVSYTERREDFHRPISSELGGGQDEPEDAQLAPLQRREIAAHTLLTAASVAGDHQREALSMLSMAVGEARAHLARTNALVGRETLTLRRMADEARLVLFWLAVALAPTIAVFALGPFVLIARPVRALAGAIRRLGEGDYDGAVHVAGPQDIRELGAQLDWLRTRLLDVEAEKQRFLRHVSHELKTPLTAVREGADILSDGALGPLTPEQAEVTGILRSQGLRLQSLIEELLAFSRLQERDARSDPRESVNLDELVAETMEDHALAVRSKSLRLSTALEPVAIIGARAKLRSIIGNLVANAIKYAPREGTIDVCLGVAEGEAILDVRDSGPGIAAVDREHVFEAFYQGAHQPSGSVRGTGLGLAIARECAHLHGGSVELMASSQGSGAHFRVRLPSDGGRSTGSSESPPDAP